MNLRGWNENIFWAGAKLFALSKQVAPVVMIDLDEIFSLSSLENLFGRQKYFTHIWGSKQKFRNDLKASEKFCRNCARRIKSDFPSWAETLQASDWAGKYF